MAPSKNTKVTQQTKQQPPTAAPHGSPSQTNAPAQSAPATGFGVEQKTAPTFNQNPTLAPKPADHGTVNIINDQRQPSPRGPRAPLGGNGYGN